MRLRVTGLIACALAGCTGSESTRQTADRWQEVRRVGDRIIHIDRTSLTTRADTLGVKARVTRGVDTMMVEFEIVCAANQFRRIGARKRGWKRIEGVSQAIAKSLCADSAR